jgi:hypothetical protein
LIHFYTVIRSVYMLNPGVVKGGGGGFPLSELATILGKPLGFFKGFFGCLIGFFSFQFSFDFF